MSAYQRLQRALETDDFPTFQRTIQGVYYLDDDELLYQIMVHPDDRFWGLVWNQIRSAQERGPQLIYHRRDVSLAARHRFELVRYFLTLPSEQKDYRYMYQVFQAYEIPVNLPFIVTDPLLVEIALDVYPYPVSEVRDALDFVDDITPSDTVDEVSEILEQWLETHE